MKTLDKVIKGLNLINDFIKPLNTLSPFDFFPIWLLPYQMHELNPNYSPQQIPTEI